MEEEIKAKLLIRGFSENKLLNNRGLIGAVIDECKFINENKQPTYSEAYVKDLEGMLCVLAQSYEKTRETYFDTHMKTCSVSNPNRRDLTKAEESEWQRFPLFQGTRLQNIVTEIANANKEHPKDLDNMVNLYINLEITK